MKSGSPDRSHFARVLYSRFLFKDLESISPKAIGMHNEALKLPVEDFDEATKLAIRIAEGGGPCGCIMRDSCKSSATVRSVYCIQFVFGISSTYCTSKYCMYFASLFRFRLS